MKIIIPYPWNFPLSQAIIHDAKYTMEISWLIWMNFDLSKLEDWIENQTINIMENIKSTLKNFWWNMNNIVKSRIFLTNMWDYSKFNEIYAKYFQNEYPTRFVIEINSLPAWALIEIECIAIGDEIINKKENI